MREKVPAVKKLLLLFNEITVNLWRISLIIQLLAKDVPCFAAKPIPRPEKFSLKQMAGKCF